MAKETYIDGKETYISGSASLLSGYCSTVQGLLDWFEVDLGFAELLFIVRWR